MQSIERTFLTTMETDCERTWRSVTRAFDPQCCRLNGAASFRCGSSSAPLVRVTFPSRHDGFRFVLPGTAQIAASSILGFSVFCDAVDQREFGQRSEERRVGKECP